jgi:hypothetical protein
MMVMLGLLGFLDLLSLLTEVVRRRFVMEFIVVAMNSIILPWEGWG